MKKDSDKSESKHLLSLQEAIEDVYKYRYYMDIYFSKYKKYEREFQQFIAENYDATEYIA
jgi:hypothetical protein